MTLKTHHEINNIKRQQFICGSIYVFGWFCLVIYVFLFITRFVNKMKPFERKKKNGEKTG